MESERVRRKKLLECSFLQSHGLAHLLLPAGAGAGVEPKRPPPVAGAGAGVEPKRPVEAGALFHSFQQMKED